MLGVIGWDEAVPGHSRRLPTPHYPAASLAPHLAPQARVFPFTVSLLTQVIEKAPQLARLRVLGIPPGEPWAALLTSTWQQKHESVATLYDAGASCVTLQRTDAAPTAAPADHILPRPPTPSIQEPSFHVSSVPSAEKV